MCAGNSLTFSVGAKQAFEVSLADVSQTQLQGKNDVILEFHVDDTAGANEVLISTATCFFYASWFHDYILYAIAERLTDGDKFSYPQFQHPVCW